MWEIAFPKKGAVVSLAEDVFCNSKFFFSEKCIQLSAFIIQTENKTTWGSAASENHIDLYYYFILLTELNLHNFVENCLLTIDRLGCV